MTTATIYIGSPKALQAEIGLLPCYQGKYVVAAFNAAGLEYTPEIATSKKEAKAFVAEIRAHLESLGETVQVSWIN